jgi:hypothetical protein
MYLDRDRKRSSEESKMVKALWIGIVLTALGALVLVMGSVAYTTEETILEVGPVEATARTRETLDVPPAIGWVSLGAGGVLLVGAVFKIVRGGLG